MGFLNKLAVAILAANHVSTVGKLRLWSPQLAFSRGIKTDRHGAGNPLTPRPDGR